MTYLQGKTPISFLQELCTKRGITPTYDLIANEGAVHEPTFVFKVTAGDFIGTGKGIFNKRMKLTFTSLNQAYLLLVLKITLFSCHNLFKFTVLIFSKTCFN